MWRRAIISRPPLASARSWLLLPYAFATKDIGISHCGGNHVRRACCTTFGTVFQIRLGLLPRAVQPRERPASAVCSLLLFSLSKWPITLPNSTRCQNLLPTTGGLLHRHPRSFFPLHPPPPPPEPYSTLVFFHSTPPPPPTISFQ